MLCSITYCHSQSTLLESVKDKGREKDCWVMEIGGEGYIWIGRIFQEKREI